MERFVFVTAVTIAIIFGVFAMFGGPHWHVDWDDEADARGMAPMVEIAPGRMDSQAFSGADLQIKHAAARIVVTPEDRQDFQIEITNPGRAPMPTVSSDDGRVIINGQLRGRVEDCRDGGGVNLRGYGELTLADLPQITIRSPRNFSLGVSGGSTTEVGPTEALSLDFTGCGSARVADVVGPLEVDLSGSGNVTAGAARTLVADMTGSGDVVAGAITEDATLDTTGSGSVTIASISGRLEVDGTGSGDVRVAAGEVTGANIDLTGSGSVDIAALNGSVEADAMGSGDVTIRGGSLADARIELAGSGGVSIRAPVQRLTVSIMGPGNVDVAGVVGELDAEIAGPGEVSVQSVTGTVRRQIMGPGSVRVGGAPASPNTP